MLNYGLVSTAIGDDRAQLLEGTRLLAKIAHKHGIPITWTLDTKTAPIVAKLLTTWHTETGDVPLLMLDIKPIWETHWEAAQTANPGDSTEASAVHLVTMREKLPEYIQKEAEKLKRALPWAETHVAGAVFKNDVFLSALEQTGFRGLWGYHWNQPDSDAVALDRGGFGCFYPFEASTDTNAIVTGGYVNATLAHAFKKIVGIPYHTAGHLAEDATNLRAALLNGTAQQHFETYLENNAWNRWLGYVEHIDSLSVAQLGQEGLERLDAYFSHVVGNQRTKLLLLSEMVDDYITHCERTEPTAVVGRNAVTQNKADNRTSALKMFYCDAVCGLTFVEGVMQPIEIKNYTGGPARYRGGDEQGPQLDTKQPVLTSFLPTRHRTELHMAITVESTKAMPYGITVWGAHGGLHLTESNADDVRWIGEYSLFIRLTLHPGKNEFNVKLTI